MIMILVESIISQEGMENILETNNNKKKIEEYMIESIETHHLEKEALLRKKMIIKDNFEKK